MSTIIRMAEVAIAAAMVAALLTGCTANDTQAGEPTTSRTSERSDSPVEEPTEPPVPHVGDLLDPAAAEALNDARGDARAYPMPDGTYVLINANEPLPPAVAESLNSHVSSLYDPAASRDSFRKIQVYGYQVESATGKSVLPITQLVTSNDVGNYTIWRVVGHNDRDLGSREEAVAYAQSIINAQPDPQVWIIVG